jgi:hypothetical protein
LVSWKQMMEAELSSILFRINGHFKGSLTPRIFQLKIYQIQLRIAEFMIQKPDERFHHTAVPNNKLPRPCGQHRDAPQ